MKKVKAFLARRWQTLLTAVIGGGLTVFLLGYHLGSLTLGMSAAENQALQGTASLKAIAENPLFLPHKLGEYFVFKLGVNLPITVRAVSAIIGFFCVWGFYLLMKRWHTRRLAMLGTLMFLCSSWFLATARSATPTILYVFNVLSVIFIGALVHQKKASKSSLLLAAVCSGILIYSPGMIWLLIIGIVWQFKGIVSLLKQNPVWLWLSASIIFGILLLPAAYATYKDPHFLLDLLAIPKQFMPLTMLKSLVVVPKELFVLGPKDSWWLAQLPIMDLFTGALFAIGIYQYYLRLRLTRTFFLLWISVVLLVLIAVLGIPTVTMLPIVYIVIASGLALLIQQWFTVFPLNPIAKNLGFGFVAVAVLCSCWFQLNRYIVAWPHNSATKQAYQHILSR
jgi:hypothetical protein